MVDIRSILKRDVKDMEARFEIGPNDGFLILLVKKFGGLYRIWHRDVFPSIVWIFAKLADKLLLRNCKDYRFCNDAGACRRMAIDLYMFASTVCLLLCYWVAFRFRSNPIGQFQEWLMLELVVLYSLFRSYEVFVFVAVLHSNAEYQPLALPRAIINTIWHYLEIVIAFGTFYLVVGLFVMDGFNGSDENPFGSKFLDSLYFSFVTMTTLGYGDFSPVSEFGKVVMFVEVLLGFFFLVVVLQRAMSAGQKQSTLDLRSKKGTPYYALPMSASPNQSPIGYFKEGTKLFELSKDLGEVLVESEDRIIGYVASADVEPLEE